MVSNLYSRISALEKKLHTNARVEFICCIPDDCEIIPYLPENHNLLICTKEEMEQLEKEGNMIVAAIPEECKQYTKCDINVI